MTHTYSRGCFKLIFRKCLPILSLLYSHTCSIYSRSLSWSPAFSHFRTVKRYRNPRIHKLFPLFIVFLDLDTSPYAAYSISSASFFRFFSYHHYLLMRLPYSFPFYICFFFSSYHAISFLLLFYISYMYTFCLSLFVYSYLSWFCSFQDRYICCSFLTFFSFLFIFALSFSFFIRYVFFSIFLLSLPFFCLYILSSYASSSPFFRPVLLLNTSIPAMSMVAKSGIENWFYFLSPILTLELIAPPWNRVKNFFAARKNWTTVLPAFNIYINVRSGP